MVIAPNGGYGLSRCLPNPNASSPIPRGLAEGLTDESVKHTSISDIESEPAEDWPVTESTQSNAVTDRPNEGDNVEEIVWPEMAEEFVQVCGGLQEARDVLQALERSGATLIDFEKKVNQGLSLPHDENEGIDFVSPSNEEIGMHFVLDCGGFEQARLCLDEWGEEHS